MPDATPPADSENPAEAAAQRQRLADFVREAPAWRAWPGPPT
ncbi:hypothetical protein [Hymenobacter arcticus]